MTYTINRKLEANSYAILKSMIGKKLVSIKHDGDNLDDFVSFVQFDLQDFSTCLRSFTDVVFFYGTDEDITTLEMVEGEYNLEQPPLKQFFINKVILNISVVDYNIHSEHDKGSVYDEHVSGGIVFDLDDGTQLSFERADEFEEMISIKSGKDLYEFPRMDAYARNFDSHWKVSTIKEVHKV